MIFKMFGMYSIGNVLWHMVFEIMHVFYAICDSNVQTCLKLNGNAAGLIEIEREGLREREIAFATEMLVLVIYSTYVCEERAILAQSP